MVPWKSLISVQSLPPERRCSSSRIDMYLNWNRSHCNISSTVHTHSHTHAQASVSVVVWVQDKVLTIGRTVFIELSTCYIVHFPWTWNREVLQHPAYYVLTRVLAIEPVCLTPGQRLSIYSWTLSASSYWQTNTIKYEYKYRSSITTVPERPHWVWAQKWVSSTSNRSAQTRPKL